MWSGKACLGHVAIGLLSASIATCAAKAEIIRCPLTHDGKPLKDVELFEGDPTEKAELMPSIGRFDIPARPPVPWANIPNYTLGCTYRGLKIMVTIVLPRRIRVCRFIGYPNVTVADLANTSNILY